MWILADIFNNLHGQVGKLAVTKALTGLVEKGELNGKAYGKQWVYVVRQDTLPAPSPEELEQYDLQLEQLGAAASEQREKTKTLQSQLAQLQSSLTNEQMVQRIAHLQNTIASLDVKLEALRTGSRKVDPTEKAVVDKQYDLYMKEWKQRKRLVYMLT